MNLQRIAVGLFMLLTVESFAEEQQGLTTVFLSRGWQGDQTYISTFREKPCDERITPMADFQWGGADNKAIDSIWPGLKNKYWLTVRLVGFVQAGKAGTYTFRFGANPGGRLMMDGRMLVDAFYGRNMKYYDARVEMKEGEKKEVMIEFWTWTDGAIRLMWKEPGKDDFVVVPQSALYPSPKEEGKAQADPPKIEIKSGFANERFYAILTPTNGTYVRYTLDGSEPTRLYGALYDVPVAITNTCTLKAKAFLPNGGQSAVVEKAFKVKETPQKDGVRIYRTGNSLTANASVYMMQLEAAAGFKQYSINTILAGNPTKGLWENRATDKNPLPERDARKVVKDNAPFDCLITQPFAMNVADEVEYTSKFYDLVLASSPKADLWIYSNWINYNILQDMSNDLLKKDDRRPGITVQQWREDMDKYIQSCELEREQLQAKYPDHKVRIIPAASAVMALQQAIDNGQIPGMKSYALEIMADSIHLGHKGCYFVSLVHYACLYGKSPVGLVVADTSLTIEQQTKMQELAWDVVKNYKWSGVAAAK